MSLIDSEDELTNEAGNLFIIEIPGSPYINPVRVEWESNSNAKIRYPAKSEIYKQIVKSDGVSIAYIME